MLGGSWVVLSLVISPRIWIIAIVTLLITPLTTTHEPPSSTKGVHVCHYCYGIKSPQSHNKDGLLGLNSIAAVYRG